jgi:hypothetical protein
MPRRCAVDQQKLDKLLPPGAAVATHAQLLALKMPLSTITSRIGPNGPWQRLLPGVVLAHRGTPTVLERRLGAQAYGGDRSILTGMDALAEHGVKVARRSGSDKVHLLVPHTTQKTSHSFAVVTRTRYLPTAVVKRGLRVAPLARAAVDACRRIERVDDVRGLIAEVIQQHGVRPDQLLDEVHRAQRQRTALARKVLREIAAGVRYAAEARMREPFARFGVRTPLWNATLVTPDGQIVGLPDALWADVWVAVELDSMAWHLTPAAYKATQRRQRELVLLGIDVIPIAPADLFENPETLCRQIRDRLAATPTRELAGVRLAPAAA